MANTNTVRTGRAYVEIFADNSKFTEGLRQTESQLRNWGSQMSALGASVAASIPVRQFASSLLTYAKFDDAIRAIAGTTQSATPSGTRSVKEFADMLGISTAEAQRSAREMANLEEQARDLGRTTSFTAQQAADAMLILARAGFKITEIQNSVEHIMNLARATGTDVAVAAQVGVSALKSFQLEAKEAEGVMDMLTATTNSSPQTLTNLGDALKYIGPVAHAMNIELKEVLQDLGLLAKFNLKGEQSGTAMRNLYMRMASSVNQVKFKEALGVDFVDPETGELRGLTSVLNEANMKAEKLGFTRAKIAGLYKDVFSLRALPAAFALASSDAYEMQTALSEAKSEAYITSELMDSGVGGVFRMLLSRVEEFGIAFYEAVDQPLISFGTRLTEIFDAAINFINENKTIVKIVSELASLFGIAALALGSAGVAAGALSKAVSGTIGIARNFNDVVLEKFSNLAKMISTGIIPSPQKKIDPFEIETSGLERARQASRYLDKNITVLSRVLVRAIARVNLLSQGLNKMTTVAPKFSSAAGECASKVRAIVVAAAALRNDFKASGGVFQGVQKSITALSRPLATLRQRLDLIAERFQKTCSKATETAAAYEAAGNAFSDVDKTLVHTAAQFDELFKAAEKNKNVLGTYRQFAEAVRSVQVSMRQVANLFKTISDNSRRSAATVGSLKKAFTQFLSLLGQIASSSPQHVQSIENIVNKYKELLAEVRRVGEEMKKIGALPSLVPNSGRKGIVNYLRHIQGILAASNDLIEKQVKITTALEAVGAAFRAAANAVVIYGDALQRAGGLHQALNLAGIMGWGKKEKEESKSKAEAEKGQKPKSKTKKKADEEDVDAVLEKARALPKLSARKIVMDVDEKKARALGDEIAQAAANEFQAEQVLWGHNDERAEERGLETVKKPRDCLENII